MNIQKITPAEFSMLNETIQNTISFEIELIPEESRTLFQKVILAWYKRNKEFKNTSNDSE